jgi:hypothetical protein
VGVPFPIQLFKQPNTIAASSLQAPAKQSISQQAKSGLLAGACNNVARVEPRRPVLAARKHPSCASNIAQENRGRRESRVSDAPAASCANVESTRVSHYRHTGSIRPSLRSGFNGLLRALPGDRALLSPSPAENSASLTPASGRQDHTTSPSASSTFVNRAIGVHRIPSPTSVTIAIRPSAGPRRRRV